MLLPLEMVSCVTALGNGVMCYCHSKRCHMLLPFGNGVMTGLLRLEKVSYVTAFGKVSYITAFGKSVMIVL